MLPPLLYRFIILWILLLSLFCLYNNSNHNNNIHHVTASFVFVSSYQTSSSSSLLSSMTKINRITRSNSILPPSLIRFKKSHHLFSTTNDNDNDNDELSKLIGKREQIKKNVKKRSDMIEETIQSSLEPMIDLDLDKLPSFKVERPVRGSTQRKDDNDNDNDDNDGSLMKSKSKSLPPIIDYMADYDDENEFHIPNRIGISTICWGDPSRLFVSGKNTKLTKRQIKNGQFVSGDIELSYQTLLSSGITLFETSPTYGAANINNHMSSEDILGKCIYNNNGSELPEPMVITSSNTANSFNVMEHLMKGKGSVSTSYMCSLESSLRRLSGSNDDDDIRSSIDMFTVSKSFLLPSSYIANGLALQIESGQCNYIGVNGITNPKTLIKLSNILKTKYDISITSNTFDFSLTNTKHEKLIQICKNLNIIPLITNPYDNGLSSGYYTASNPSGSYGTDNANMSGSRVSVNSNSKKFTFQQLEKLQPLHSVQETLIERIRLRVSRNMSKQQERFKSKKMSYGDNVPKINTDITTTQMALQYIIAKGGVPLVPCNTPKDSEDIIGCLGWTLNSDEVAMLDAAIALCKM